MKMKKLTALALSTVMAVSTMAMSAMASEDWKSFKIDPAAIPQEKLDTTLSVACSIRGLENPYINTIKVGMEMFCEYLDSI